MVQANAEGLLLAVGLELGLGLADRESSGEGALVSDDEDNLAQRTRKQILAVRCDK